MNTVLSAQGFSQLAMVNLSFCVQEYQLSVSITKFLDVLPSKKFKM